MVKHCDAHICWHVIRTYIKGWDSETYMTYEDYSDKDYIGKKHRTVTNDTFKLVYEKVWKGWYKQLTENEMWDDLDLVRFCLDHNYVDEMFSAIFCDEAQDFTRTEIDFILKLSCFSNRKLDNIDYIFKLPFVFAGDEFQTLTPTGFSWESIRGYFSDRIFLLTGLETKSEEKTLPKTIEFVKNYRSTPSIVRVANRIQLLRASRFDEYSKPQEPYFKSVDADVFCVSPNADLKMWSQIKDNNVYLIVPKDENESIQEYIERTPLKEYINVNNGRAFLKSHESCIQTENESSNIKILSTSAAKGGEYTNVLLYGYGIDEDFSRLTIDDLIRWYKDPVFNNDKDIELKYQICNAYVAITRAKKRLYIIDDFSKNSFWSILLYSFKDCPLKFSNDELERFMLDKLNNKNNEWGNQNLLGWVTEYKNNQMTFVTLNDKEKLKEINSTRETANNNYDSETLRQLAVDYQKIGMSVDYFCCLAEADLFDEKYDSAAQYYLKANKHKEYIDCYWEGYLSKIKNIDESISKIGSVSDKIDDIRAIWCNKLSKEVTPYDIKTLMNDILSEVKSIDCESDFSQSSTPWKIILDKAMNIVILKKTETNIIKKIIESNKQLKDYDISIDSNKLAQFAYNCHAIEESIIIWESIQKSLRSPIYFKHKWENTNYPQKIEYAAGTKDPNWHEKVIFEYRNHKELRLEEEHFKILLEAIRQGKYENEYKVFFPYILTKATSINEYTFLINESKGFGIDVNKDVLYTLAHIKLELLEEWSYEFSDNLSKDVNLLFRIAQSIKKIKNKKFSHYIDEKLQSGSKPIDIIHDYLEFKDTKFSLLFFSALGKVFENRNKYTDILNYYEVVKNMSHETTFKKYMDSRWIVYKEKQAIYEYTQGNKIISENYTKDATRKRDKWDIAPNKDLTESQIDEGYWIKLFEITFSINKTDSLKTSNIIMKNGDLLESSHRLDVADTSIISKFLLQFGKKDALKYTTHVWDEKRLFKDYNDFMSQYSSILLKWEKRISELCPHLWKLISNFLLSEDGGCPWSEYEIKIGYNKYVKKWMDENPDMEPMDMPLSAFPVEIRTTIINENSINKFQGIIAEFKKCIEFREDDLQLFIEKLFDKNNINYEEEPLDCLNRRTFYTDTERVKEALRIIANNIYQHGKDSCVKVFCKEDKDDEKRIIRLEFLQEGSFSNRDIKDPKITAEDKDGDLATIKDKLKHLCDFAVESKFRVNDKPTPLHINYLVSDESQKGMYEIPEDECPGFKYILTFYSYYK